MAKSMTPEDAKSGETAKHNIANVNAAVIDGFQKRLNLQNQIAALVAEHITPLKDDLKNVIKDQKKDSGMHGKDLNVFYAVYKRQEEAKTFVEDDDRDIVLDNMRVIFEALESGDQLDFIDAVAPTPPDDGTSDETA